MRADQHAAAAHADVGIQVIHIQMTAVQERILLFLIQNRHIQEMAAKRLNIALNFRQGIADKIHVIIRREQPIRLHLAERAVSSAGYAVIAPEVEQAAGIRHPLHLIQQNLFLVFAASVIADQKFAREIRNILRDGIHQADRHIRAIH